MVLDVVRKHLQTRAANQEHTQREASLHWPPGRQSLKCWPVDAAGHTTSSRTRLPAGDREVSPDGLILVQRLGAPGTSPPPHHQHPARPANS